MANGATTLNEGSAINIVAWVSLISAIIAVLTKLASKWQRVRSFMTDDYCMIVAVLIMVGQTLAVNQEVHFGLGRKGAFKDSDSESLQKADYAASVLYVLPLCFSKLSTVFFVRTLAPFGWVRYSTLGFAAFVGVWTLASMFAQIFQCGLPQPWALESDHCYNKLLFWAIYGSIDILTDVFLVVMPAIVTYNLNTNAAQRANIIFSFATRGLTIPLIVLRLVFLNNEYAAGSDTQFHAFQATIVTQIQLNASIMLACVPFIKTVIDNMQSGLMTTDMRYAPATYGNSGSRGYRLSHLSKGGIKSTEASAILETEIDNTHSPHNEPDHIRGNSGSQTSQRGYTTEIERAPHQRIHDERSREINVTTEISVHQGYAQ